ncbi:hypothetical protein D3C71_1724700 [compost metagenome]
MPSQTTAREVGSSTTTCHSSAVPAKAASRVIAIAMGVVPMRLRETFKTSGAWRTASTQTASVTTSNRARRMVSEAGVNCIGPTAAARGPLPPPSQSPAP